MRSRLSIVAGLLALALLLGTAASDWPLDFLRDFWSQHGMLTNLFSNIVFLIFAAAIVERLIARGQERRLRTVTYVAYRACSRIPLMQRRLIWLLTNGGRFHHDQDFQITGRELARLRVILRRNDLAEVDEKVVMLKRHDLPNLRERLESLVKDPDWVALSYSMLRRLLHTSQAVLARWSGLLLTTDESALVLRELADQTEQLSGLFAKFISPPEVAAKSFASDEIEELIGHWRFIGTNATAAYIAMLRKMRLAGMAAWEENAESLLAPVDRAALRASRPWTKGDELGLYRTIGQMAPDASE